MEGGGAQRADRAPGTGPPAQGRAPAAAVWIVTGAGSAGAGDTPGGSDGAEDVRLFGLTGEERIRRALREQPVAGVHVGAEPPESGSLRKSREPGGSGRPREPGGAKASEGAGGSEAAGPRHLVALRGDILFDERLVHALLEAPPPLLLQAAGEPVAACVAPGGGTEARRWLLESIPPSPDQKVCLAEPDDLVPAYHRKVRKRQPAYALPITARSRPDLERMLFDASYKGVTDLVTKWLWPRPAFWVTRVLAPHGVTPNMVTAVSWVLAFAAAWLFAGGHFAGGLVLAWTMTFLDTVDGKLARVTLRSSWFGNLFDHVLDIVHPPVWYVAWALPFLGDGSLPWLGPALGVILAGYAVGRFLETVFKLRFGFSLHLWQPVDSRFRLVSSRRNPNLLLLTAGVLLGRPELALLPVAAWSVASDVFHGVRLATAEVRLRRGEAIRAWQAGEQEPTRAAPAPLPGDAPSRSR